MKNIKSIFIMILLVTSTVWMVHISSVQANSESITIIAINSNDQIVQKTVDHLVNNLTDYSVSVQNINTINEFNAISGIVGIAVIVGHGGDQGISTSTEIISPEDVNNLFSRNVDIIFPMFLACNSSNYITTQNQFSYTNNADHYVASFQAISVIHQINQRFDLYDTYLQNVDSDKILNLGIRQNFTDIIGENLGLSLNVNGFSIGGNFEVDGQSVSFDLSANVDAGIRMVAGGTIPVIGVTWYYPVPYFNGISITGNEFTIGWNLNGLYVKYGSGPQIFVSKTVVNSLKSILTTSTEYFTYKVIEKVIGPVLNMNFIDLIDAANSYSYQLHNVVPIEEEGIPLDTAPATPSIPSGPIEFDEDTSQLFTFTTTDSDSSKVIYEVNWGTGSNLIYEDSDLTKIIPYTYTTPGSYTISARASSGTGWSNWSPGLTVNVLVSDNAPETPGLIGPTSINEDTIGSWTVFAVDPDSSQITIQIDWGDSSTSSINTLSDYLTSASHSYANPGTYTAKARAKSASSAWSSWSSDLIITVIQVDQAPGTPTVSGPTSINEDAPGTWFVVASDPDSSQITIEIDWGDGTTSSKSATSGASTSFTHTYANPGNYNAKAKAKSANSVWSSWSNNYGIVVNYVDLPPSTPSLTGASSINEDTIGNWIVFAIDPDSSQITIQIDWGDGSTSSINTLSDYLTSASHSYANPGTYTAKARAKSGSSVWSSWSTGKTITVNAVDQAPNKPNTPSGPGSAIRYSSSTWSFYTTDPDSSSITMEISWGDGTTSTVSATSGSTKSVSHTYSTTGTKYIKVRAKSANSVWSAWSNSKSVSVTTSSGGGCTAPCPVSIEIPTSVSPINNSKVELDTVPVVVSFGFIFVGGLTLGMVLLIIAIVVVVVFIALVLAGYIDLGDLVNKIKNGFNWIMNEVAQIGATIMQFIYWIKNWAAFSGAEEEINYIYDYYWGEITQYLLQERLRQSELNGYLFYYFLAVMKQQKGFKLKYAQTDPNNPILLSTARGLAAGESFYDDMFIKNNVGKVLKVKITLTAWDIAKAFGQYAFVNIPSWTNLAVPLPGQWNPSEYLNQLDKIKGIFGEVSFGAWANYYKYTILKMSDTGSVSLSDWLMYKGGNNYYVESKGIITTFTNSAYRINFRSREGIDQHIARSGYEGGHAVISVYILSSVNPSFGNVLFIGWLRR